VEGVMLVYVPLQELAFLRVHRGLEQLFGVHFAEALESLDLHPTTANLEDLLEYLRNRKERMQNGSFAFAFDQFEDWPITGGIMADFQTFAGQLGDNFFDFSPFWPL